MVVIEFFTDLLSSTFSDKAYNTTLMSQLPKGMQKLIAIGLMIFFLPVHLILIIIGLIAVFKGQWIGGILFLFLGLFFAFGLFKILKNIHTNQIFI